MSKESLGDLYLGDKKVSEVFLEEAYLMWVDSLPPPTWLEIATLFGRTIKRRIKGKLTWEQ